MYMLQNLAEWQNSDSFFITISSTAAKGQTILVNFWKAICLLSKRYNHFMSDIHRIMSNFGN